MVLKNVTVMIGVALILGAGMGGRAVRAQTPQAPRPAQPMPPADPAKPAGPPQGSSPSPGVPKISVGAPSSGAAKETPYKEDVTNEAASTFIKNAGHDGLTEIDLARLAQIKATRADVKAYAQMLGTDHQKANDELMAIAKSKLVTIPTDSTTEEKAARARLEKLTGTAFDKAYTAAMIQDHTKAIAAFVAAAKNADTDVKDFADKTLPTLRHHLEEAQRLAKSAK